MLEVLYEDNHIIAVNKRASEIVQGDKTGDRPLPEYVKDHIRKKYNKPGKVFLGVVHRLDRPVSGVILFARTSKALTRLNEMFREKKVRKIYWAIIKNKPQKSKNTLIHYLLKNQSKNKSQAFIKKYKNALRSELSYKLIHSLENYHLLEVCPKTGRHHQIRAQLAKIGCPIKGDIKYGFNRTNNDKSIHLHARKIDFMHPVNKELISITAPTPNDTLWQTIKIIEDQHLM